MNFMLLLLIMNDIFNQSIYKFKSHNFADQIHFQSYTHISDPIGHLLVSQEGVPVYKEVEIRNSYFLFCKLS